MPASASPTGRMESWFAAAGIEPAATDTLAGGTLTVKLWLGRRPSA